jgi:hypothetical protein
VGKRGKAQGNAHPSHAVEPEGGERFCKISCKQMQLDSMNAGDRIGMKLFYCCFLYYNGGKCGK